MPYTRTKRIAKYDLQAAYDSHLQWLENPYRGDRLSFTQQELVNHDMRNWNLTRARFVGCDFAGANLDDSTLEEAELIQSYLYRVKAHRTNWTNAKLHGSVFLKSPMQGSQWAGADFRFAYLLHCDFGGGSFHQTVYHNAFIAGCDFRKAEVLADIRSAAHDQGNYLPNMGNQPTNSGIKDKEDRIPPPDFTKNLPALQIADATDKNFRLEPTDAYGNEIPLDKDTPIVPGD